MLKRFSRNELLSLEYESTPYAIKCLAVNTYYFGHKNDQKALTLTWVDRRDIKETSDDIFRIFFEVKHQEKLIDTIIDNLQIYRPSIVKLHPDVDGNFVRVPLTTYVAKGLSFLNNVTVYGWMKEADFNRIMPYCLNNLLMDYPELIDTTTIDDLDEAYNTAKVSAMSSEELKKLFDVIKVNKYYRVRRVLKNSKNAYYSYPITQLCYDSLNGGFDYCWSRMISNFHVDIIFTSEEEAQIFLDFIATSEIRKNYDLEIVDVNIYGSRELVKIPIYISAANIIQPVYVEWAAFFQQTPNSTLSVLLNNPITSTKYTKQSLSTLDDLDEGISWIKYIK